MTITRLVPGTFCQTPQAAEFLGYAAGMELADDPFIFYGDCSAVVNAARLALNMRYSARRKYAAVLRIADGRAKCQAAEVIKVKAHQHLQDSSTDEQRRQIIGNGFADTAAKEAKSRHPCQDQSLVKRAVWDFRCAQATCKLAAAVMRLFPRPETKLTRTQRNGTRGRGGSSVTRLNHDWRWSLSGMRCARCWTCSNEVKPNATVCCGRPRAVMRIAKAPMGHCCTVHHFGEWGSIVICRRCGAWTSRRRIHLAVQCTGRALPGSTAARTLCKVLEGRHPLQPASSAKAAAGARPPSAGDYCAEAQRRLDALRGRACMKQAGAC